MRQNAAVLAAILCVVTLGLWGQFELSPERLSESFAESLYQILMLFALEGDWTLDLYLPWQLEITRLLAPMVSVAGVIIVLTRGAWVSLINSLIHTWRDHVVLVGLGEKGWQFAQTCGRGHRLVIVERDVDNPFISKARNAGLAVIQGDILDENIMRAAEIRRARHLVAFCGNDGTSVEIAMRVREFLGKTAPRSQRLRVHLHVDATEVAARLESYPKFYDDHKVAEVTFFSANELTARILLKKYPPDVFAHALDKKQVHIALYEFGSLAEHVLTETVRICHFVNASKVRFSVVDVKAGARVKSLLSRHPGLTQLCDIDLVELPFLNPPELDAIPASFLESVTQHVICLAEDDENLELALLLRTFLLEHTASNAPINVRMQRSSGLARLLEAGDGEPEIPDGIYPFGMLSEVVHYDNILSDGLDQLARALHEDYLERRKNVSADHRLYTSLQQWNDLSEPDRKSSRLQADHLAAKLRAVRCRYVEETSTARPLQLNDVEATAIARMEHERWLANKIFEGWRRGLERIEGARVNPFSVPWEELDQDERAAQIAAIKRLPELLRDRLDWSIKRELYVGVTGHLPHRFNATNEALMQSIERTLSTLVEQHPDHFLILVSPLAQGADSVIARLALERYGMTLHVPLPLPFELYKTDYGSAESLREFKELAGKAEVYYELSMRFGSLADLAARVDGQKNNARDHQYALVGAYLAQFCDVLIAVYDGEPARGVGGTAQIVEFRKTGAIPAEYQIESNFIQRPILSPPIIVADR